MINEALSGIERLLGGIPVVPVLTLERVADAVPIATALAKGGLRVLEVTLRTSTALESVVRIANEVPEAFVGVGSVIEPAQFEAAKRAGACFAVSPGATLALHAAAAAAAVSWLPGAQSVSEVITLRQLGYRLIKFFPAEASGGTSFLRSIAPLVPDVRFCPSGGITRLNASEYLRLANVACVGGSWFAPAELVSGRDWQQIRVLAQQARALRP